MLTPWHPVAFIGPGGPEILVVMLVLLVLFPLLHITGVTNSTRLYFLFYPVLFPWLLTGILSLRWDIASLLRHRRAFRSESAHV